jgi:hypothetical protein
MNLSILYLFMCLHNSPRANYEINTSTCTHRDKPNQCTWITAVAVVIVVTAAAATTTIIIPFLFF